MRIAKFGEYPGVVKIETLTLFLPSHFSHSFFILAVSFPFYALISLSIMSVLRFLTISVTVFAPFIHSVSFSFYLNLLV